MRSALAPLLRLFGRLLIWRHFPKLFAVGLAALALLWWWGSSGSKDSTIGLPGRVIGVSDGDTLTLLTQDKQQVKIRLAGIDAPELKQAWGQKAKQALSAQVLHKLITARETGQDRYGRTVAHVYQNRQWINQTLVQEGHAWVHRQYSAKERLLAVEAQAKKNRRGLWNLPENQRLPPWDYRRNR